MPVIPEDVQKRLTAPLSPAERAGLPAPVLRIAIDPSGERGVLVHDMEAMAQRAASASRASVLLGEAVGRLADHIRAIRPVPVRLAAADRYSYDTTLTDGMRWTPGRRSRRMRSHP